MLIINLQDENNRNKSSFLGYYAPDSPLSISLIGIFGALTCVLTMIISIPIPATQGFINIGDAAVMLTSLLFGPIIGAIAGGIGSALADVFLGYIIYAPATLIIKGLEGFFVGLIADPKRVSKRLSYRDILGVVIGGLVMVFGYFIYEIILFGVYPALIEIFLNGLIQYLVGISLSLLLTLAIRKEMMINLPTLFRYVYDEKENLIISE